MSARGTFFDEVVRELRGVPLGRLPQVVATIRSASSATNVGGGPRSLSAASATSADALAELVLALPAKDKLAEIQRVVVLHAVEACGGNISAAARMLGVDRKAMERRYAKVK